MNLRYQSLQQLEAEMEACLAIIGSTNSHVEHSYQVTQLIGMLNELPEWPANQFSEKWHQHELLVKVIRQFSGRLNQSVLVWFYIAKAAKSEEARVSIRRQLKWMRSSEKRYLLASNVDFNSPEFIRIVYSSESQELIALYQKYFAAPNIGLFAGHRLPQAYQGQFLKQEMATKELTMDVSYQRVESAAKVMQRFYRAKMRKKSEAARIAKLFPHDDVVSMMAEANKPYVPRCDSAELKDRIMKAAENVTCFTTVSHYTSVKHLASVFDDGLCGRRTLRDRLLAFDPAALHKEDIMNGDADTICLGPHHVDPDATKHGVQITFNAVKLAANNPSVFVKQKDFGLALDVIRSVKLKDRELHFSYTHFDDEYQDATTALFLMFDSNDGGGTGLYEHRTPGAGIIAASVCVNHLLMTSNTQQMHTILTLNFFRFIDGLRDPYDHSAQDLITQIYKDINSLSEDELQQFMNDIAIKMTDSVEFNMNGCHLINFDTVISIARRMQDNSQPHKYHLLPMVRIRLVDLIEELNSGLFHLLEITKREFPTLFNSHRFLGYLLSCVQHPAALARLREARELTPVVKWYSQLSSLYKNPTQDCTDVQLQRYTPQ